MTTCSALQQELSETVCIHCICTFVFESISESESLLWYKRSAAWTLMVFLGPIRDVLTTGKLDSLDGNKKYSYNDVHKKAD